MPSTASKIDIYNMALDLLQEVSLTSTADEGDVAGWLNRNYPTSRDAELRSHPWNFALTRASVAEDSTAPTFEWLHQYTLPADLLALRTLTEGGKINGKPVPYEVEGEKILTDCTSPLKIRYIRRVTNEGEYDPLFVEALVAKLAWKMAHWMTGKSSFVQIAQEAYTDAVLLARGADAIETTQPDFYSDDVIEIRQ